LSYRISQILGVYLQDVIPFRFMMDKNMSRHGFLFADDKGPWSTDRLTKILTDESSKRIGFRMTVSEYRHIAIAIDRQFIRGTLAEADEEEEEEDDVHDLMAAHNSRTAIARYARREELVKGLTPESINAFRPVSDKWQIFYNLISRRQVSRTPKAIKSESNLEEATVSAQMTAALKRMYGAGAKFKTEEQKQAVISTAMGTTQLFVILPTGQGKSLTFMLPALQSQAQTTIVITPLVALAEDMLRRCKEIGIDAIIYGGGHARRARIVIIITESAISGSCIQFIQDLHLAKSLDRIVFDECHKLLHDQGFRPKLAMIKDICMEVQLVYLTATFPPTMLNRYKEAMCLQEPRFVRLIGHKLRTRYNVETLETERFDELANAQIQSMMALCQDTDKVLVFCRSKRMSETWAKRWDCQWFNSETKNKGEVLGNWTSGLMFATGSLGAGVDIINIRAVIHLGEPYGMIDFDQEVGRGGRGGENVQSWVLLSDQEAMKLHQRKVATLSYDERAMHEFLTTSRCRRTGMSQYLNGEEYSVNCEELEAELCDNCKHDLSYTAMGKRRAMEDEASDRRVRQRQSYERRQSDLQVALKDESTRVEQVMVVVELLQSSCPCCWICGEFGDHDGKRCERVTEALGMTYEVFKGNYLRYDRYSCCFKCSLPQGLCGDVESGSCTRRDVILPLILVGFVRRKELELEELLEEVTEGREFGNILEFIEWIGKKERVLGQRGTNAFKMFERMIATRFI
jgi:superfamily II DNA helicase RecQ